ncbi:MAG: shikimate kinase [Bacteroidaceae bacterium]|nr:shikimate kinase [Bacteroidaceae bacterium]
MGRIILVGYMGAGKTTIGKVLARQLGYEFRDLDLVIECQQGKRIPDIFADEGEGRFRELERDALRDICRMESAVIAVGGGTPCFHDNMEYMNRHAITIYLKASVDTLIEHIHISSKSHGSNRPLLHGMDDRQMRDFISANLPAREQFYSQATHVIDIEILRTEEQISETAKKISSLL